ncbi:MAG: polysaccharide biosynthesis C-terminal domain-containing protein [Clostridiales bacterium]|nr:polysaccharide biosynthesis C-terminal domain-containing protein [Clostridiales bacterium]
MNRPKKFLTNALILSAAAIFMRTVSVVFGAYVSGKIGAEGMGLLALTTSAYSFAVTLATSGINLAVTRLVSGALAENNGYGVLCAVKKCIAYAATFGILSATVLYFGADFISERLLSDIRTLKSLKALSFSLPFIAITNVFSGYFTAVRRVYKNALSNVAEQFIKIALTLFFIARYARRGVEMACFAVVLGMSVSEGASFVYMLVLYLYDKKKHVSKSGIAQSGKISKEMLGIALPVALSAYLRSGLSTAEHILIPRGLEKFGAGSSEALSLYGVVHGMVLPLVLFPSAICATFASLIVPELSELYSAYGRRDVGHIKYVVSRSVKFGLIFSVCVSGIMITFADALGEIVYANEIAGKYIRVFGALVPIMYIDTAVDGMLKGLGEQLANMRYNIIDAGASVILVLLLVPRYGINGYVMCVFITETLNAVLSISRLVKVTGARIIDPSCVLLSPLCAAGAVSMANLLFHALGLSLSASTALSVFVSLVLYIFFLISFGVITSDDIKWLCKIIKS